VICKKEGTDPLLFVEEYVLPAIELYRKNRMTKHLAIHAMTQVDVLAEVVALWEAQRPREFRDELGDREPVLALIRDAHDSHKHGKLNRTSATERQGQRPEQATRSTYFPGHYFLGEPPTPYVVLVFTRDNGTEEEIYSMLHHAMQAWEKELRQRKILTTPGPLLPLA
jgi:hypothetical protein